ncbi:MAG TPA: ribosome biogenesis GTPase Der, partial [Clostridiales bacterium]|nr:ribosome biogenesis GTPase Der [Clostridiales bacterium]
MPKPTIAIVGRPNVGKSTFFNKLIGKRISIVDNTPGITRDRIMFDIDWNGVDMLLVDTGGIEPKADTVILKHILTQAQLAIDSAAAIIFMTDIKTGVTAADREVATMLKRSRKPVILAVNKVDGVGDVPPEFYEFYELGFGDPIPLSSIHGTGSGDILDKVVEAVAHLAENQEEAPGLAVAVIGKPNSGKSSLVNQMLGEERVIVSPIAGTTRDAVDTPLVNAFGKYTLIDTAGIRRSSKVEDAIERYSVLRANMAVERADVCLIMIDAQEMVTQQDERIAGIAHEAGKASILCVNKWDLIEKDNTTTHEVMKQVYSALSYMTYAPIMTLSAKTGQRVDKIYELINEVAAQNSMRVTTGLLNDLLNDATTRVQPPSDKGKRLKIYYMTQIGIKPPTFVIFCNNAELFHFSYRRYI